MYIFIVYGIDIFYCYLVACKKKSVFNFVFTLTFLIIDIIKKHLKTTVHETKYKNFTHVIECFLKLQNLKYFD